MVFDDQCWHKSLVPLMDSVREQMGDMPVYFTFDIDGVDAAYCPGTCMWSGVPFALQKFPFEIHTHADGDRHLIGDPYHDLASFADVAFSLSS